MALITNNVSYFKLDDSLTDELGLYTMTGGTSYVAGKINNTRAGNISIASITSGNNFVGTGSWTINFWANRGANTGGFFFNARTAGNDFSIDDGNVTGKVRFLWWNTGSTLYGGVDSASAFGNGYQMGTAVFDATANKIYFYINGTVDANYNGLATTGTTHITNNQTFDLASALTGNVDEVGMWTRALSSTEITSLYNSGSGFQYPFASSNTGAGFFLMM